MTATPAQPTRSPRAGRKLALVFLVAALLLALVALGLLLRVDGQPLRLESTVDGATVIVAASQTSVVLPTDCVLLDWQTRGVTDVTLGAQTVPASGRADVCLDRAAPGVEVTLADGARQRTVLPLRVNATQPLTLLFLALPVFALALSARLAMGSSSRAALLLQIAATLNLALVVVMTPLVISLTRTEAAGGETLIYMGFALWGLAGVVGFALCFARLSLLAPDAPLWAHLRSRPVPRLLAVAGVVVFWLGALRLTALLHLLVSPFALLPVYVWAAALGIGALWLVERDRRSWAFYVALSVAAVCVIRDTALSSTFYFLYETDAVGYFRYARFMFDPTVADIPVTRTLNYPLVINLLLFPFNSGLPANADSLWRVIHFQMFAGALAAGLLVYVLGRRDRTFALVAGIFLALDVVWGAYQRWVFTESLTMSCLVFSLAVMVSHYHRARRLRWPELLLAGVLFGWTLTIRPSNVYFVLVVALIYFVLTRSVRKTAFVGLGIGLFLLAASLFNLWRFGGFHLSGQQGFFLGVPAFGYQLYAPDNGPVSAQFQQEMAACLPNLDLTAITIEQVNFAIFHRMLPCFDDDIEPLAGRFGAIFREGLSHNLGPYMATVLRENAVMLAYPIRLSTNFALQTTIEMFRDPLRPPTCGDAADSWCRYRPYDRDPRAPALAAFASATSFLTQPYLLLAPPGAMPAGHTAELYRYLLPPVTQPPALIPAVVAWFALLGFTVYSTRGQRRFVVLVSAALIHYVILTTTAAIVFDTSNTRYLALLTPFFELVSAAFFIVALSKLRSLWLRRRTRKDRPG